MKNNLNLQAVKKHYILLPRPANGEKSLKTLLTEIIRELNKEKLINTDVTADLCYIIDDYLDSVEMMDEAALDLCDSE